MTRRRRLLAGGETHHVIQRGNDRMAIFFEEEDRWLYPNWLAEAAHTRGVFVHAQVLISNHVHRLLIAPRAASLARLMQSPGRRHVSHVNGSSRRTGTLWEGRYRSTILDNDGQVLTCHRYIEANPLRLRMVANAGDYPWSSFRHNALGESDPLLSGRPDYAGLRPTPEARRKAYRVLFEDRLDEQLVASIRDATQRGWLPGSERFREQIAAMHGRRAVDAPRRDRPPKPKVVTPEAEISLPFGCEIRARRVSRQNDSGSFFCPIRVEDAGLRDAADGAIHAHAIACGYVLVTKDKDFVPADTPRDSHIQIVWIRTGNVSNRVLVNRLAAGWPRILAHLEAGASIVELR